MLLADNEVAADQWSKTINLKGYNTCTLIVTNSTLTGADGSNYQTATVYEADTVAGDAATAIASFSAVASGDLVNSFSDINDDTTTVSEQVAYIGKEETVAVKLEETSTGVTAGAWTVVAQLGRMRDSEQTVTTAGAVPT